MNNSDDKSIIADQLAALCTEEGLQTILNGIGEGFYAVDRDWRIILFNDEAARHFRRTPEEVLGRNLWEMFPRARETGLGQLFLTTMQSRETVRSETESVIFRGHWLAYRLFPLGDGIGVVFRDITDRRHAEAQRDLLIKELEHRIKNTLTLVQSIADQTFRNSGLDSSATEIFAARLVSLSNVHAVLTQRSWDSADLHEIIVVAVGPHRTPENERFAMQGPILRLGPKAAPWPSTSCAPTQRNTARFQLNRGRSRSPGRSNKVNFAGSGRNEAGRPLPFPNKPASARA